MKPTDLVYLPHAARHHVDAALPELLRAERVAGDYVAQELPDPDQANVSSDDDVDNVTDTPCAQTRSQG